MRIKNLPSISSMDGSQDALIIEQTDGSEDKSRKVSPAQIKQYVLGNSIDDIYSVMGQNGAKNLIPYPYYESDHTESGITWTVNSDGSVTANGTATANSTFIFRYRTEQTKFVEKNTSYILSGCPSGGSSSKYLLDLFVKNQDDSNVAAGIDYGNGRIIDMPDQDYYGIYAFARVISGQTVSNLTFKPMLRLASDTDNTYQPYAKTNKELTEVIGDLSQTGLTGDSVAEQLTTAGGQIAGITDGMDVKTVRVTWPSSGTMLDRATNIVTQILTSTSFSKQFNIVNILENNAASSRLGQFLYSAVSSGNYGEGIFFSYYTDNVCKVKNANGTITVKQLSEV